MVQVGGRTERVDRSGGLFRWVGGGATTSHCPANTCACVRLCAAGCPGAALPGSGAASHCPPTIALPVLQATQGPHCQGVVLPLTAPLPLHYLCCRPPRGCTAREWHGLSGNKGLVFAEQLKVGGGHVRREAGGWAGWQLAVRCGAAQGGCRGCMEGGWRLTVGGWRLVAEQLKLGEWRGRTGGAGCAVGCEAA